MLSGNNKATANIDGSAIQSEENQVLLGITIDSNLSFNNIKNLCKKVSAKLIALAGIFGFMNLPKRKMIVKYFVTSQFAYSPFIWIFDS